ncbi:ParB/RepB/Spo0J family partition protein [Saccharopolyspora taberi]|uniref:ParB N-terminal domain-containing protein n=1 Tax=Saccharopolyspora taberi TaxID=60895 RepID=A0ABN3V3L9_9PSEU
MEFALNAETISIPLELIRENGSVRAAGENPEHVRLLAEIFDSLPPVLVHSSTLHLIDGLHRVRAARLRGHETIKAQLFEGSESEAFVLAVRANVSHGLPLSLTDRKSACVRIISMHPDWSNRRIARVAGISPKTVGSLRENKDGSAASRVGQDGRVRPLNASAGRQRAAELILANPDQSLRQVARAAGVSPETVRDVRRRLSRNEGPTPSGARPEGRQDSSGDEQNPENWRRAVRTLQSDPAMRYTEHGRLLLRLLSLHVMDYDEWASILRAVPEYARPAVSQAAQGCVSIWTSTVRRLEEEEEPTKSA